MATKGPRVNVRKIKTTKCHVMANIEEMSGYYPFAICEKAANQIAAQAVRS